MRPPQARRQRFIEAAARLAAEVFDFHQRWEDGSPSPSPPEVIRRRMALLDEELRELRAEFECPERQVDEARLAEEAADVMFVAIGNLEQLGAHGLAAMDRVSAKNAAKTARSHYVHQETGKITRRLP